MTYKIIKNTCITLTLVVLLLVITGTLFVTFVDPGVFKDKLSQFTEKSLNRKLTIAGSIDWSFFPWLGLKVKQVQLDNPKNSQNKQAPLLKVGEIDFKIKVLPLFEGKTEISKIIIKNPTLNLTVDADGHSNWDDLVKKMTAIANGSIENHKNAKTNDARNPTKLVITHARLTNGKIIYQNNQTNQHREISHLNFSSQGMSLANPFPIKANFDVAGQSGHPTASINLNTNVTMSVNSEQLWMPELKLTLTSPDPDQADHETHILTVHSDVFADLRTQIMTFKDINAKYNHLTLTGKMKGEKILTTPLFNGAFSLDTINPATLLKDFGYTLNTAHHHTFKKGAATFNLQLTPKYIKILKSQIRLDEVTTNATGSYTFFDTPKINFNATINNLDLNRYLPFTITPTHQKHGINEALKTLTAKSSHQTTTTVDGDIQLHALHYRKITLENVTAHVALTNDKLIVSPIKSTLFGGTSQTNFTTDFHLNHPFYTIDESFKQVDLRQLLPKLGIGNDFGGKADGTLHLTTYGSDANQLINRLSGNSNYTITNGVIDGINIGHILHLANAISLRQPLPKLTEKNVTKFSKLTASAFFNHGIVTNNDLVMHAPDFKMTGKGNLNLKDDAWDYQLKAFRVYTVRKRGSKKQLNGRSIPIRITGHFTKPKLQIDYSDISKSIIKQQLKDQLDKQFKNTTTNTLINQLFEQLLS